VTHRRPCLWLGSGTCHEIQIIRGCAELRIGQFRQTRENAREYEGPRRAAACHPDDCADKHLNAGSDDDVKPIKREKWGAQHPPQPWLRRGNIGALVRLRRHE
jgi:hypothetical protein